MKCQKIITKSIYMDYLICPKNTWLKLYRPDIFSKYHIDRDYDKFLMKQGVEVEILARNLFPDGINIDHLKGDSVEITNRLISEKYPVIFQPKFNIEGFLAKCDVLKYDDKKQHWILYEIKSKTSTKSKAGFDPIEDASFQYQLLKQSDIKIEEVYILHLNKDYLHQDQIDISKLFVLSDITDLLLKREQSTKERMQESRGDLHSDNFDKIKCSCIYKLRDSHCSTFHFNYSGIPEYSVHDISNLHKNKLRNLIDSNLIDVLHVPDNFDLTLKQESQVIAAKLKEPLINKLKIKEELEKIEYPIFFLDYEDFGPAIPKYNNFKPYQHIPFQFSLHVVHGPGLETRHEEFLHETDSDPSLHFLESLSSLIGPKGSIIVWYKSHEEKINNELASRNPKYLGFIKDLNNRIFDLEKIFSNQLYIHPGFKGKSSIKNILPTLFPNEGYENLGIQDGKTASIRWAEMIYGKLSKIEKDQIIKNLKQYCFMDTYAMYLIWNHLNEL